MLLKLEGVLDQAEIAEVRRIVESAKWVDGSVSGNPGLKKNLQADRKTAEFDTAIKKVVGALMARPEFISYAIPRQVTLEFNRYDPGMFYKNHVDAALMGGLERLPLLRLRAVVGDQTLQKRVVAEDDFRAAYLCECLP